MLQNAKILIIEDDADTAEAMEALCRELGHKPVVAHNGLQGLELANRVKPELILSDIAMPGIDGFEVARRIRANHELDGTVIVAVTGTIPRRPAAGQSTFDDYVIKPFTFEDLEKVIAKFTTERA